MNRCIWPLFFIIITCCTYAPDDVFFNEKDPTPATGTVSLNEIANGDTIWLYDGFQFSYSIATSAKILQVEVLIDGKSLMRSAKGTGDFNITEPFFKTGTYDLSVVATTSSGTNSVADITGNEKVQVWGEWVLVIDVDPPPPPVLTMTVENRFLTLRWTPFKRGSFVRYEVVLGGNNLSDVIITDPNVTTLIDSTYSEGQFRNYVVVTRTALTESRSNGIELYDPQAVGATINRSDSTVRLTWRKSKYANFKDVTIAENTKVRKVIVDPDDTTFVLKMKESFLGDYSTTVKVSINARYPAGQQTEPLFVAKKDFLNPVSDGLLKSSSGFQYCTSRQSLMALGNDSWLRLYDDSMDLVDSVEIKGFLYGIPIQVGAYIYYQAQEGIARVNLVTKDVVIFETPGHSGTSIPPLNLNYHENIVSYLLYDFSDEQNKRVISTVKNLESGETLYHTDKLFEPNGEYGWMDMSPDGMHGIIHSELYSFTGSTFTSTQRFIPADVGYYFRADKGDEMFYMNMPPQLVSANDLSIIRTIYVPKQGLFFRNYDPVTKRIWYTDEERSNHYLVDVDTQDVIEVKTAPFQVYSFLRGTLFTINGQYKKIL